MEELQITKIKEDHHRAFSYVIHAATKLILMRPMIILCLQDVTQCWNMKKCGAVSCARFLCAGQTVHS